jgi:hypothetical protein
VFNFKVSSYSVVDPTSNQKHSHVSSLFGDVREMFLIIRKLCMSINLNAVIFVGLKEHF